MSVPFFGLAGIREVEWLLLVILLSAVTGCSDNSEATLRLGQVQGAEGTSPLVDQTVTVEGVVTGGSVDGIGGFFIQDVRGDGKPKTSDALFVIYDSTPSIPERGRRVRATGRVVELGSGDATLTALADSRMQTLDLVGQPDPVMLEAPPDNGDWEPYEGMLVKVATPLTVSGTYDLGRYGEIVASFGGRLFTPTEVGRPGTESRSVQAENRMRRILLDDFDMRELNAPPSFLDSAPDASHPFRIGSIIQEVIGVVDQRRGEYRLQVVDRLSDNMEQASRPSAPEVDGDTRVAVLNVLNLFNGDGRGGDFPTPRGARTPDDYRIQQEKLVATLQALAPDVAALMEIENDGYGPYSALAQFVDALNRTGPIADYRYVDVQHGPGADAIRVAVIYRSSRIHPVGDPAVLQQGPFLTRSRVPVAQAFWRGDGPAFVVVANHFKSKSCGRDEAAATGSNADQGDGQSCWNATRVESARLLDEWIRTDPTGTNTRFHILVGDFNAYSQEDPIRWLREVGWRNVLDGPAAQGPHTYVYSGEAGRLDHAFVNSAMGARLRGAAVWHANSDELPDFTYYNSPDTGPYRASDHDPILLGFDLGEQQ